MAGSAGNRFAVGNWAIFFIRNRDHSGGRKGRVAGRSRGSGRLPGIPGLLLGGLLQQGTSFLYTSPERKLVTQLTFQPFFAYQLGQGWYLRSRDATWTFNLRHNTSTEIPLRAGIGKVWKFRRGLRVERLVSRRMDVVLPIRFADRAVDFEIPSDDVVSAPRTMRKRRHYV